MHILYIGGTGQISFDCIHESIKAGHEVTVYNRGNNNAGLPAECNFIQGDIHDDDAYFKLADHNFDVVCQFHLFTPDEIQRDIDLFTGHCDQYVFISSASAYQKPVRHHIITEDVPLINPYWQYSDNKAQMEALLQNQSGLPYTIVRPSHTSRSKLTTAMGDGDVIAHRMLAGKPVIVPGDGTSLWTITYSTDFAPPFVKLLGNDGALNDHFHLTSDNAYMWNEIYAAIARALSIEGEPTLAHIPTDTLVRYNPAWVGPLLGDKTWSVVFDNSKIKSVVGDFTCDTSLDEFNQRIMPYFHERAASFETNAEYEALVDRIITEQGALGS
ncbi:MAG: NAD-dependent epimerase/dehydratase family protein [Chloroflexota bacterium]